MQTQIGVRNFDVGSNLSELFNLIWHVAAHCHAIEEIQKRVSRFFWFPRLVAMPEHEGLTPHGSERTDNRQTMSCLGGLEFWCQLGLRLGCARAA